MTPSSHIPTRVLRTALTLAPLLALSCAGGDDASAGVGAARANLVVGGERCPDGVNIIVGTAGDDVLVGTSRADCILGYGGDDHIEGLGGRDALFGGDGNDEILGGRGADQIHGGAGEDRLEGGRGADRIWGEEGDDILHGGNGADTLKGGAGDDQLFGDGGRDKLSGGDGDDVLVSDNQRESLRGQAGCDILDDRAGRSTLQGGAGDDVLMGGAHALKLAGGGGNDVLRVESRPRAPIDGGGGVDACSVHGRTRRCERPEPLLCATDADCAETEHCLDVVGLCVPDSWCTPASPAPPRIRRQPRDFTGVELEPAWFHVRATGRDMGYQWRRNGAPIPGATGDTLLLEEPARAEQADDFDVVVSNPGGSVVSDTVHLHLDYATPSIVSQPVDQMVPLGSSATFSVVTRGSDVTYQWRRDGADIPGATAAGFTLPSVALADDGARFDVIASNPAGNVTSTSAELTIDASAPVIRTQPVDVTVDEGGDASFLVVATGASAYQWRRDGTVIAGATAASYTLPSATLADDGAHFDVLVSNPAGSVTSAAAVLSVHQLAPAIVAEPVSVAVDEGGSASFSVVVVGSGVLYQWRRNGADIVGANTPTYTLTSAALTDDGSQFSVRVQNAAGSVTSASAVLTVRQLAPAITTQPADVSVTEGEPAAFSVVATGSGLTYQWRRDAAPIAGATTATYTIPAAPRADDGAHFSVVVSNGAGSVTSTSALLSVGLAVPVISAQPTAQTVTEGAVATFAVTATGSELLYQWRRDGTVIAGATSASYTLTTAAVGDEGALFSVVVSNGAGSVTSVDAALHVTPNAPVITTQPADVSVDEGAPAVFSVVASGSLRTYQWRRDGLDIAGATGTTYNVPATTLADDGAVFSVVVTNPSGSVTSAPATLTVRQLPPTITAEPVAVSVPEGSAATFVVSASGTALGYQWQRDGVDIVGATTASLRVPSVSLADDGARFRCVVSNGAGSVTSGAALLTVTLVAPAISIPPAPQTVVEGGDAHFSVVATGSLLRYQWLRDGLAIAGATLASYTASTVSLADDGARYAVTVSNGAGSVTSAAASLSVQLAAPVITLDPENQSVLEGAAASFSIAAAGSALTYQWQRDGAAITGANAPSYTLPSAQLADDLARFRCVVQNAAGAVISGEATLHVQLAAPAITGQPADVSVVEGEPASFGVVAAGSLLGYQWRRDGADIPGATSADYVLSATTPADDGSQFSVVVSNAAGTVTSRLAALHVSLLPPVITAAPADQSVTEGAPASFVVSASGTALTYQWRRDGSDIPGATAPSYGLAAAAFTDDGASFSVRVSNSAGSVTSVPATLSVALAAPRITTPPSSLTLDEFSSASFSVVAEGSLLSYQWRRDGANIPGATSATYTLTEARFADSGASFSVVVANGAGSLESAPAVLGVNLAAPSVTTQPIAQTVVDGDAASFSVVVRGSEVTYQWRRDGVAIPGAAGPSYSLPSATLADDGVRFSVVASNAAGSVTSGGARLTVQERAPVITSQPSSSRVDEGADAGFRVTATGSVLRYQWLRDGAPIAGATSPSYDLLGASLSDDGVSFSVTVSNGAGSVTSAAAVLSVTQLAPRITTQPADLTLPEGAAASFEVTAAGSLLSYRWERDGVAVPGGNESVLALGAVVAADDGAVFRCVVSNGAGSVTSSIATLHVTLLVPVIDTPPSDLSVVEGEAASFSVSATGTALGYQWRRDGVDVVGATSTRLDLATVSLADDGARYSVRVSNSGGSVTSAEATLSVSLAPPRITTSPASQSVAEFASVRFDVAAEGSLLSYQWRRDGGDIPGATGTSYGVAEARYADDGARFDVVVTNAAGSVASAVAVLSVTLAAPTISMQPVAQTVQDGEPASFSVSARGSALSYQWRRGGAAISGATAATYTLPSTTLADDGASFDVVVSNAAGSVTSEAVLLHVDPRAPVILTPPSSQTVDEGAAASFSVVADGSALSYQWRRDGVVIDGATAVRYTLSGVSLADHGASFDVVVSNAAGSLTSGAATLSVRQLGPVITAQPVGQSVVEGSPVSFSVTATGSALSYQWQRDGADIPGANASTLDLGPADPADDGHAFRCVVSNPAGSATSSTATLHVSLLAPVITGQPSSQSVTEGQGAGFSVSATGTGLSYQWQRDGVDIVGATGASHDLAATSLADDGAVFRVVVSNTGGSVTSAQATLHVAPALPVITSQPVDVSVDEEADATFHVGASGSLLSYQWQRDGVPIVGATAADYVLGFAGLADDGAVFRVVVSNAAGAVTSDPAVLHVRQLVPLIDTQPSSVSVIDGDPASFSVIARGSGLSYQWRRAGLPIAGATSATYDLGAATLADDGARFDVVVQNGAGSVASAEAVLSVTQRAPSIVTQPSDQVVDEGADASFSVVAGGSALSYQWRRDGADIVGATAATYVLSGASVADDGASFSVSVQNAAGTVVSAAATLSVTQLAPQITTQPADANVLEGDPVAFSVIASGSGLSYQWLRDGAAIAGATGPSFDLGPADPADDGARFSVVVSNAAGNVTSSLVSLHVSLRLPSISTPPVDHTVTEGASASFSVAAVGTALSYQWRRGSADIPGATSSSYTLAATALSDDGARFSVVITNAAGSVSSAEATLHVQLAAPRITTQPSAITVNEGADALFSVAAEGSLLSYQWERDGVVIAGASSSTYTLAGATLADAGALFRVVVTNAAGSVTSAAATLGVTQIAPTITTQPLAQTVEDGSAAMFSVVATGTALSYQWQRDGIAIFGATSETLTFTAGLADDGVSYRVVVSNGAGSITSAPAPLTVAQRAPSISVQPVAATVTEGGNTSFSVTADGSALSYRWQKNGTDLPGETTPTLVLNGVPFSDDGAIYQVVIANLAGSVTSAPATLTVQLAAPVITAQPSGATVDEGAAVSFSVSANGSLLSYQWRKDGADLAGATTASLGIAAASYDDRGGYSVVVSNAAGSVTSATATLAVNVAPPVITSEPADASIAEGGSASFSVAATGSLLSYQWSQDGASIAGATEATYAFGPALLADDGATFRVTVTNPGGSVVSRSARLAVALAPPIIVTQPSSVNVTEGEAASFSVVATGTDLTYQWFKDGAPASGSGATLSIPAATQADAGSYHVLVSNAAGSVPSVQATLSVSLNPPVISSPPVDVTVAAGANASFTVAASGTDLSYQWQRNGIDIPGATSATYSLTARFDDDGASFLARVQNAGGSVASSPAVLHVSDDTPPDLLVDGPSTISTDESLVVLTGTATDSGVGLLSVSVASDREATVFGAIVGDTGAFSVEVPLSVGANTLTVSARDRAGNEAQQVVTVTETLPVLPVIQITAPLLGYRTMDPQIQVSGSVRSQLAADEIRLSLGDLVTFPTGSGGEYSFVFDNVPLSFGTNVLTVEAHTVHGMVSAQTVVAREDAAGGDAGTPPVIAISGAASEVYLTTDEIPVSGSVTATRCVNSVTVNGLPATVVGEGAFVSFDASLSFSAAGSDAVIVVVQAEDCDGLSSVVSYVVRRDDAAPAISVTGLTPAPAIHPVLETPHRVSGTVTDDNIAGFSLGGMSVGLMPTADPRVWSFEVDVALVRAAETHLTLQAWDLGGNRVTSEIILRLDAEVGLSIVSPSEGDELLATGATGSVDVVVSAPGLAGSDTLSASVDGAAPVSLAYGGSRGSGSVTGVSADGPHVLVVEAHAADGRLIAGASVSFDLIDESTIPLELTRQLPENNQDGVEANQFITLFFNKPVDPARMQVQVRETLHGRTYEAPRDGADLRTQSDVRLDEVSRDREPVPGHAMNLPGNTMVAFYPSRDYGYDGEIFVDVLYDGATIGHTRFHVRPLPTLVQGFVADHDLNPLANIQVSIPALGRTTTTNADGNYDFGWGESAAQTIPPGMYRATLNPGMQNPLYGTLERDIRVRAGEVNSIGVAQIPRLDPEEPFHPLTGGAASVVLARGDLTLDLSAATVTFPDGSPSGSVRAQLMEARRIGYSSRASAPADWGFVIQPGGIRVSGDVGVSVRLPAFQGSYEYLDSVPEYGLLLGLDPASLQLVPVGVARIDITARTLTSQGLVQLQRLDYIAFARVAAEQQALLTAYVAGDKTLLELVADLEGL